MKRFERRRLDPALFSWSMETVKGVGILAACALLAAGCKENREIGSPEGKPESPLEKVDKIISNVEEGVKPLDRQENPPPIEVESEEEVPSIPVAVPVPDKPGFVISPYNGKWIDVTGVKPGILMADPHFTDEKKFFRVPEIKLPSEPKVVPQSDEAEPSKPVEGEKAL